MFNLFVHWLTVKSGKAGFFQCRGWLKTSWLILAWLVLIPCGAMGTDSGGSAEELPVPAFSELSGFFSDPVVLHLSHPNPEATIVYTLDGSEPCLNNLDSTFYAYKNQFPQHPGQSPFPFLEQGFASNIYEDSLIITDRTPDDNKISMMSSTWDTNPNYFPSFPVRKATVVRARAFWEDQSSDIATHTYFVFDGQEPDYTLPIVAITLPGNELFDYEEGIYTAGVDFDQWRLDNPLAITSHIATPANFQRRGVETEKLSHFQYFVDGHPVMSQDIGIRIHGGGSRYISNKNLRFYARNAYDDQNSFDYPVFDDEGFASFKRFILRFDGRQNNTTTNFIRDHLLQDAVAHLNFDTQSYYPNVLFLNGEYWGLYGLMTRYDKHYFERVYGIEEEELDYLFNNADPRVGDNEHYLMMYDFVDENDMSDPDNFEFVKTLMDVDNFRDYYISQIYMGNHDWPGNNINFFRKRTETYEPDAPYGQDGRWRWLMADLDHGFGATRPVTFNYLEYATAAGSTSWANYDWATLLMRNLLEYDAFRDSFIIRFADLINTTFLPERMVGLIDHHADRIAPEVPRHIARWNRLNSFQAWQNNIQLLRNYANQRPDIQRQHIIHKFELDGSYSLEVDVSDQKHGFVRVNTIDIHDETPGIEQQAYPWSGIYFNDMPLRLEAIAASGYVFSHWEGDWNGHEQVIKLSPRQDIQLTAHFVPSEEHVQSELIHFWVMDTDIPNNTPLMSLSATYSSTEAIAEIIYESCLEGYPFSEDHPNWRKASMERRNAPTHVNYMPEGNNNLRYGQFAMRGLQVRQPFRDGERENGLIMHMNTSGHTDISVSFAVKDEGAVQGLIFDYWTNNDGEWSDDGMAFTNADLADRYQLVQIDLSQVEEASQNPEFRLRIRFVTEEPEVDQGDRVTFNNIAVKGVPLDETKGSVLTIILDGDGMVEVDNEPYTGPMVVPDGTDLTLEAIADDGWRFEGWSGDLASVEAMEQITMEGDCTIKATFGVIIAAKKRHLEKINIYPNPFSKTLWVENATLVSAIKLINLWGQTLLVKDNNRNDRLTIPVGKLPQGVYLLQLTDYEGKTRVVPLVKQTGVAG